MNDLFNLLSFNQLLLPLALTTPLFTAIVIFLLGERRHTLRTWINMTGALLSLLWIGLILWGVYHEYQYEFSIALLPETDLLFQADALAMLFATLSATLWRWPVSTVRRR